MRGMELRVVRYFLAVTDHGSITRAAVHLNVAQPSLSRQIRQLEDELGGHLFERSATGVRLTPAGERFAGMARDLVSRAEAAERAMDATTSGRAMPFTVVAPATTMADVVAPFLATTGPDSPAITVREELPNAVFPSLVAGQADLAISSGPPPAGMISRPLARFAVWAYVPRGHAMAHRRQVTVAELVTEPLIALGRSHGTRQLFDQVVADAGLGYRIAFETDTPQIAQALAASGHGVAIVTDDPRYGLHHIGIEVGGEPLRIPLFAAWNGSSYAADSIAPWVEALSAFCAARPGAAAPRVTGA